MLRYDPDAKALNVKETTERNPYLPSWCLDLHYRSTSDVLAGNDGYHAGFNIQTMTKLELDEQNSSKIRTKSIIVDTVKTINIEEGMDMECDQWRESINDAAIQCNI